MKELIAMKTDVVCIKCWKRFEGILKDLSDTLSDKFISCELYAELDHGRNNRTNLWKLDYITTMCLLCGDPTVCSKCELCKTVVCLKEKCAQLVFAPKIEKFRHILVCRKCVVDIEADFGENGDGPGFLSLSKDQKILLEQDPPPTCDSCSLRFSFFLQPFNCEKCGKFCCRRCCNLIEGENKCKRCVMDPNRARSVTKREVCDHCSMDLLEQDLVWLNMNKLHAKCLQGFKQKSRSNICSYCGKLVIGDEKMTYNNELIHNYCLAKFRKMKQEELI
jgi:hypothetical protein